MKIHNFLILQYIIKFNAFIILIIVLILLSGCGIINKPEYKDVAIDQIFYQNDPIQNNIDDETFVMNIKGQNIEITKKAWFDVSAQILRKKRYYSGIDGKLAPWDFAMGWGKMADKNLTSKIKIDQMMRFYFYEFSYDSPLKKDYIATHSSNMHLIPKNKNLFKVLKLAKKDSYIRIKGYLVFITIPQKRWHWNSSLVRTDTGNGACELIYVEEIIYNDKLYR